MKRYIAAISGLLMEAMQQLLEQDIVTVRSEVVGTLDVVLRMASGDIDATFALDDNIFNAVATEVGISKDERLRVTLGEEQLPSELTFNDLGLSDDVRLGVVKFKRKLVILGDAEGEAVFDEASKGLLDLAHLEELVIEPNKFVGSSLPLLLQQVPELSTLRVKQHDELFSHILPNAAEPARDKRHERHQQWNLSSIEQGRA